MFELHAGIVGNGAILFTRQFGVQTLDRVTSEIARMTAMGIGHDTLPEIVDLSHLDGSELTFNTMRRIVRITCETAKPDPTSGKRIAVYAPYDLNYGLTRIHSALLEMEESDVLSAVFRTEVEVLKWLNRPETCFAELEGIERVGPLSGQSKPACEGL